MTFEDWHVELAALPWLRWHGLYASSCSADGVTSRPGATEGKPIYRLGRLRPWNWGGWRAVWSMQRSARRCAGLAGDWSEAGGSPNGDGAGVQIVTCYDLTLTPTAHDRLRGQPIASASAGISSYRERDGWGLAELGPPVPPSRPVHSRTEWGLGSGLGPRS